MGDSKRHHYVPEVYLKNFSYNKRDVKNSKINLQGV